MKMKFMLKNTLVFLLLSVMPIASHAVFGQTPQDLVCGLVFHINHIFLDKHVIFNKLSPKLEQRTIEQYIK